MSDKDIKRIEQLVKNAGRNVLEMLEILKELKGKK